MSASIRGHQGQIRLFKDGALLNIVDITRFEVNQDSTFSRTHYVGRPVPEGDQSIEGWSGTIDLEVKDDAVDSFIDDLVNANLNGIGVPDCTLILTENYPDGRLSSYVYFDAQFKMSKTNPGGTEKVTKRLEFQCSGRQQL